MDHGLNSRRALGYLVGGSCSIPPPPSSSQRQQLFCSLSYLEAVGGGQHPARAEQGPSAGVDVAQLRWYLEANLPRPRPRESVCAPHNSQQAVASCQRTPSTDATEEKHKGRRVRR